MRAMENGKSRRHDQLSPGWDDGAGIYHLGEERSWTEEEEEEEDWLPITRHDRPSSFSSRSYCVSRFELCQRFNLLLLLLLPRRRKFSTIG